MTIRSEFPGDPECACALSWRRGHISGPCTACCAMGCEDCCKLMRETYPDFAALLEHAGKMPKESA